MAEMKESQTPSTATGNPSTATGSPGSNMFAEPRAAERSFPTAAVAIAAAAVLILAAVLVMMGRRHGAPAVESAKTLLPAASYAPNLQLSGITLSESTSLSGGKETYVDGHLTNTGPATLIGVTMQVLFAPEGGGSPQLETVPLNVIRMRQPYVDTEPVSATAPLGPGASADFRLIFDDVRPEWNQQPPEMHAVRVMTR